MQRTTKSVVPAFLIASVALAVPKLPVLVSDCTNTLQTGNNMVTYIIVLRITKLTLSLVLRGTF